MKFVAHRAVDATALSEFASLVGDDVIFLNASPTGFAATTSGGFVFTFTGNGIQYDQNGEPEHGSIKGVDLNDPSGDAFTFTKVNTSIDQVEKYLDSDDPVQAFTRLFKSSDRLIGSDFADSLNGYGGADKIIGNGGGDIVSGGRGSDKFYLALDAADTVLDFKKQDKLVLDDATFGLGNQGHLKKYQFVEGTVAGDADDRLIYDIATGELFFDSDGDGFGAAVHIATLANRADVSFNDLFLT